jgi:hypothetical protein
MSDMSDKRDFLRHGVAGTYGARRPAHQVGPVGQRHAPPLLAQDCLDIAHVRAGWGGVREVRDVDQAGVVNLAAPTDDLARAVIVRRSPQDQRKS